jgi:hypothetical protein
MFRFADATRKETFHAAQPPAPCATLTLSQVLARVEQRLRWYGFADWRIRDAVCLGGEVTVMVRSPCGRTAAFTVAREGGAMAFAVVPESPVPQAVVQAPVQEAVVPRLARTLGKRAIGALWPQGRFLSRPALCQG